MKLGFRAEAAVTCHRLVETSSKIASPTHISHQPLPKLPPLLRTGTYMRGWVDQGEMSEGSVLLSCYRIILRAGLRQITTTDSSADLAGREGNRDMGGFTALEVRW